GPAADQVREVPRSLTVAHALPAARVGVRRGDDGSDRWLPRPLPDAGTLPRTWRGGGGESCRYLRRGGWLCGEGARAIDQRDRAGRRVSAIAQSRARDCASRSDRKAPRTDRAP